MANGPISTPPMDNSGSSESRSFSAKGNKGRNLLQCTNIHKISAHGVSLIQTLLGHREVIANIAGYEDDQDSSWAAHNMLQLVRNAPDV